MTEITDGQLAEWERTEKAATPGPWDAKAFDYRYAMAPEVVWHAAYPDGEDTSDGREVDARFIAAARTAVPALLAEVRRLRAEIDDMKGGARTRSRRSGGRGRMNARSPMDQLLDAVEWTARDEPWPKDTTMPYATHEGTLRIGDVEVKVARLNDGRAVIEKGGIDAIFGGDVAELFRSIERVESLKRDLLATIEGMRTERICEDPAPGDPPLSPGATSPSLMAQALRATLAKYGNAAAIRVVVAFDRTTLRVSFAFCDAETGAEFATAADILEALER